MTRLLIVQPYVPSYRVPLFRALRTSLSDIGIEMRLAAGAPDSAQRMRGDDQSASEIDYRLAESRITLGSRTLIARRLGRAVKSWNPDHVIIEQAIKNVEMYPLLVRSVLPNGARLAMWGQGRSYSTRQTPVEAKVKQWATRRCDWFFSYTEAGARYVVDHGFPARRVTVLNNTIDTSALQEQLRAVSDAEVLQYRNDLGLTPGCVGLFLGGVDERKGIAFLLDAARRIAADLPGFVLLVGGSGTEVERVRVLQDEGGPVRSLGRVDGHQRAIALRAADVMLIPEWVGLVAIDSLVSGRPIVTTEHDSHSPEFEYLRPNENAVVVRHDAQDYASAVSALLRDRPRLDGMSDVGRSDAAGLSLESMVQRYTEGVRSWCAS